MKKTLFTTSLFVKVLLLLRPDLMKKYAAVFVTLILIISSVLAFLPAGSNDAVYDAFAQEEVISPYKTINPQKIPEESKPILLGKVLSNETANIYPRRSGIVQDIYFDIGDKIEKGQVLAILLPPGVEGENTALIDEKKAQVNKAYSNLTQAKNVAYSSIEQEKIRLLEKELAFQNMIEKQKSIVNKAQTIADTTQDEEQAKVKTVAQEVKVIEANIDLLKDQLMTSKSLENDDLIRRDNNISQSLEQIQVVFSDVKQVVEHVLLGEDGKSNSQYIDSEDIDANIGIFTTNVLNSLIQDFNAFSNESVAYISLTEDQKKERAMILIENGNQVLMKTQEVLNGSITRFSSSDDQQTHNDLTNLMKNVNNTQKSLLKAKEHYQDALNEYQISKSSQYEKITLLENQIEKQRENLLLAKNKHKLGESQKNKNVEISKRNLESAQVVEKSDLELLQAQVDLAREKVNLTKAQQNKMISTEASNLQIANAQLQKEVAKSGNTEIKSPFSGIISKRSMVVGEMVSTGMPAFELVDVKTSLSEKAKREIQFQLPEELNNELNIGDTLEFSLLENDIDTYQALVTRKSPQVDGETHSITVQAKLDDSLQLPHNLSVRIRIIGSHQNIFTIPSSALKRENDNNFVWVLSEESDIPKYLIINVFADDGEFAEISGDIDESLEIILDPPDFLIFEDEQPDKKVKMETPDTQISEPLI